MRILSVVALCGLLAACSCGERKANVEGPVPDSVLTVIDYKAFLAGLDAADVGSMTKAVRQYAPAFAKFPVVQRDSGYALFEAFYDRVDSAINAGMDRDTTNYEPLTDEEVRGLSNPVPPDLKAKNDRLRANGFRITSSEGIPFFEKDRAWLEPYFYKYLSTQMRQYLEQLRKEDDQRFTDDAAVLISATEFADRTVWWENFDKATPRFPLRASVNRIRKGYLTALMQGMDNSPVRDFETGRLSSYYDEAWRYLVAHYPNSDAARLLLPYHAAWQRADTAAVNVLLRTYRSSGQVDDWGDPAD
ncbi:hypothetical protein [Flaviaesturariibacter aridisoli]|uniref:Uncharacterized protein n=1 Tax=Flaviaesturariibacter aridisoli TaxID=2545761 RepID=A0A4R4E0Z3_9BACT|nr:hypothetical protein [Flaviaesturariibacter aridisoli]TCZ71423.1 hypothetical protein E0486_10100 [Flaviaesturariibacter aridisoli]